MLALSRWPSSDVPSELTATESAGVATLTGGLSTRTF